MSDASILEDAFLDLKLLLPRVSMAIEELLLGLGHPWCMYMSTIIYSVSTKVLSMAFEAIDFGVPSHVQAYVTFTGA